MSRSPLVLMPTYPMGRIAALDAPKGSFVLVPGGLAHDFENLAIPGNFEQHMPGIAEWFAEHPPGRAGP